MQRRPGNPNAGGKGTPTPSVNRTILQDLPELLYHSPVVSNKGNCISSRAGRVMLVEPSE